MKIKAIAAVFFFCTSSQALELKTDQDRVNEFGPAVDERLQPLFEKAGVDYPPKSATLIAFKDEKVLEVYAPGADRKQRFITSYPIVDLRSQRGPKLRRRDMITPEGLYEVSNLNPNSQFHLALRVNYPNPFDRAKAAEEKREDLGREIMITGRAESHGCITVEDLAVEDLFVLAAKTNYEKVKIIITPVDFRHVQLNAIPQGAPPWTAEVYASIRKALKAYPLPPDEVE